MFRDFLNDDTGSISLSSSVLLMTGVMLIVFNLNLTILTGRRIEVQHAADSAAFASGTWAARGMNSITAANHLIGELTAFVILHEALGGKKHETEASADFGPNRSIFSNSADFLASPSVLSAIDSTLQQAWVATSSRRALLKWPPRQDIFELTYQRTTLGTGIRAESTFLDSRLHLKRWLTVALLGKGVAADLTASGNVALAAAGSALEAVMDTLELRVGAEYRTINALETVATLLTPMKRLQRDVLTFAAKRYTTAVRRSTPEVSLMASRSVAALHHATAELFPTAGQLSLPVMMDPLASAVMPPRLPEMAPKPQPGGCGCPEAKIPITRRQIVRVTQLCRATFPWVNYHRQPLLSAFASALPLAKTQELYHFWSNWHCDHILHELQQGNLANPDSHLGLYVMQGTTAPDKGFEDWTEPGQSLLIDKLFTATALVCTEAPTVVGTTLFSQEHPAGLSACASVLLYNANDQIRPEHRIDLTCSQIRPVRQASVGMDTLNWKPGSLQKSLPCENLPTTVQPGDPRPFEFSLSNLPSQYPAIQINWQCKLIPVTSDRLQELTEAQLPYPFNEIYRRLPRRIPRQLATH